MIRNETHLDTLSIVTPHAVIHIDSEMHLYIRFYDDHAVFSFVPSGILKGGEISLTHNQVLQMIAATAARQNWQSGASGTTPRLCTWWDHEYDQLNIDLIRIKTEIELFGRLILESPDRKAIIDAIKARAKV
jgi:hypothetical protein